MILLWQRPRPWQRQSHFLHFHLGQGHSVTTFDLIVIRSSIQPRTTGSKQTNTINIYTSVFPTIDIHVSLHCGLKLSECGWGGDFAARLGTPGLLPSDPSWASSLPNPTQNTTSFPPPSSDLTFWHCLPLPGPSWYTCISTKAILLQICTKYSATKNGPIQGLWFGPKLFGLKSYLAFVLQVYSLCCAPFPNFLDSNATWLLFCEFIVCAMHPSPIRY